MSYSHQEKIWRNSVIGGGNGKGEGLEVGIRLTYLRSRKYSWVFLGSMSDGERSGRWC